MGSIHTIQPDIKAAVGAEIPSANAINAPGIPAPAQQPNSVVCIEPIALTGATSKHPPLVSAEWRSDSIRSDSREAVAAASKTRATEIANTVTISSPLVKLNSSRLLSLRRHQWSRAVEISASYGT